MSDRSFCGAGSKVGHYGCQHCSKEGQSGDKISLEEMRRSNWLELMRRSALAWLPPLLQVPLAGQPRGGGPDIFQQLYLPGSCFGGGADRGVGKPSHQSGLMRIFGVRKATALFVVVDVAVVRKGLI